MTDLGLTPSLCHLGEYPLQKYTLLHLCVIVPNLAEMFLLGHLQNSISSFPLSPLSPLSLLFSLFSLPSPSLRPSRACAHYRSFVFLLSQVSQGIVMDCDLVNYECIWDCVRVCLIFYAVFAPKIIRNTQSFHILSLQTCANSSRNNQLIEEKRPVVFEKWPVVLVKTTCRFLKSDPSFFVNRRVVLWSESVHSFSLLWHLWQQKMQNPCNTRVCVYARAREKVFLAKWRRNTKQCCTKVSKLFWGEWCQWKGDTNRVQQALCFLLLLSNLSDSKTIYILSGIESTSLKIVGIQNRFCSFSLIFHSFPYYLPLYICRAVEHRIQTTVLFAYGHKKWDTTVSQPC